MNKISIRPSTADDMPALGALLLKSYAQLLAGDYTAAELNFALPRITRAQPALVASGTYFVAERLGSLVGSGGWTRAVPGGAGPAQHHIAHIRHVATDPDIIRAGIGRAIMQQIFDTARAAGVTKLECYSTRTAVTFYAALGFKPIAPINIPLGDGIIFAACHMGSRCEPDHDRGRPGIRQVDPGPLAGQHP